LDLDFQFLIFFLFCWELCTYIAEAMLIDISVLQPVGVFAASLGPCGGVAVDNASSWCDGVSFVRTVVRVRVSN